MARGGRRLPNDPDFPPVASDWETGEISPNVVFREGKWWDIDHYEMDRKDELDDLRRFKRNRSLSTFLANQSASTGL